MQNTSDVTDRMGYRSLNIVRDGWQWALRTSRSVFAFTPGYALSCLLLYALSQVAFLIAVLLPWKILVLLSSDNFPRILPSFLARYDQRELVLILSVAALTSLLVHLVCEGAIGLVCGRAASAVLDRHKKTGLFNSHREQGAQLYRRLLRSLSSLACCGLIVLWLAFSYSLLLFALASYLFLGLVAAFFWHRLPLKVEYRPPADLLTKAWWGVGFLYLVSWVVADYWRGGYRDHMMVAFVSLLVGRQVLVFAAALYQNASFLYSNQSRVNALFDADAPWMPSPRKDDGFQNLLDPGRRKLWVGALLSAHGDFTGQELDIHCRSAEGGKLIYMTVVSGDQGSERAYFLKLYHRSLDALAQHEVEVLQVAGQSWPVPRLLGCESVEGNNCLAFEWAPTMSWLVERERTSRLYALGGELMKCELPDELIARYDRSQPKLSRRLGEVNWSLLRSLAPSREIADRCEALQSNWTTILDELDALPRQLVLQGLSGRMMGASENGAALICNWTRWRWEPIGAGWPLKSESYAPLADALRNASGVRAELREISTEQSHRSATLFEFERLHSLGRFPAAIALVGQLSDKDA